MDAREETPGGAHADADATTCTQTKHGVSPIARSETKRNSKYKETHLDDSFGGGYGASDDRPGRDVDARGCTPVPFARDVHDARV